MQRIHPDLKKAFDSLLNDYIFFKNGAYQWPEMQESVVKEAGMFSHGFKPGDTVRVNGKKGTVVKVSSHPTMGMVATVKVNGKTVNAQVDSLKRESVEHVTEGVLNEGIMDFIRKFTASNPKIVSSPVAKNAEKKAQSLSPKQKSELKTELQPLLDKARNVVGNTYLGGTIGAAASSVGFAIAKALGQYGVISQNASSSISTPAGILAIVGIGVVVLAGIGHEAINAQEDALESIHNNG
jgi:hypothetical protein